jgi:hypothetical protein
MENIVSPPSSGPFLHDFHLHRRHYASAGREIGVYCIVIQPIALQWPTGDAIPSCFRVVVRHETERGHPFPAPHHEAEMVKIVQITLEDGAALLAFRGRGQPSPVNVYVNWDQESVLLSILGRLPFLTGVQKRVHMTARMLYGWKYVDCSRQAHRLPRKAQFQGTIRHPCRNLMLGWLEDLAD